ncbi:MAG: hypothetical protein IPL28_05590 [Chloroflexi bacterium]|nr:hypothetical protein [Chloroflexota bacterium]
MSGGYQIIGHSDEITNDLARQAELACSAIELPRVNIEQYSGHAMFSLGTGIFVALAYRISSVPTLKRGFSIYKHYVFISREELKEINYDLSVIFQTHTLKNEIITPKKKKELPPLKSGNIITNIIWMHISTP